MADPRDELLRAWMGARNDQERAALEQRYQQLVAQRPDESVFGYAIRSGFGLRPETLQDLAGRRTIASSLAGGGNPTRDPALAVAALNMTPQRRTEQAARSVQLRTPPAAPAAANAPRGLTLTPAGGANRAPAGDSLFSRLLQQESGDRQFDSAGNLITSSKGAFGAAQLMPETAADLAREMGVTPEQLARDPELNRRAGERYLQQQLTKYGGSQVLALAAYNAGPGRVDEWIRRFGDPRKGEISEAAWAAQIPYAETKAYVSNILGGGRGGPNLSAPSPQDLMRFIPDPERIPLIDLPDAPQAAAPAARPTLELADKEALLAPIREAMAIKPRDVSQDAWDRVQGMLQGAAMAAAGVGPEEGIGSLLLAAGAGGLGGFREERGQQRQLNREEEEAQRQVRMALANLGFEIDTSNIDTRNQNNQIDWQSGEDVRITNFANANSTFENMVREMMANSGITAQNVGNRNQVNMARGQIGAGAVQDAFNVQNQSTMAGWELGARAAMAGGGVPGAQLLAGVGLTPERQAGEPPEVANARTAAGLIAAGNVNAGLSSLATELVLTGRYANPELLDENTIKQVEQAIQQEKPQAAVNLILAQLQAAPDQQQAVVDLLAGQGSIVASMLRAQSGGAR